MSATVIAVCGKGGVGKTTVSAIIAQALSGMSDRKALLIDADHAGGLAMALGIDVVRTVNDVRLDTIGEIKKGETDKRDLAASIDYMLMEAATERGNLAFLPIGRPEEVGCYCAVHTLLREAIELLADKFDVTVIDAEAGIEQVNRNVLGRVDQLILVADTSAKAVNVAQTIRDVAREISDLRHVGLLLNRVRSEDEVKRIMDTTDLKVMGWIPDDDNIRRFDAEQRSFLELPDCPAVSAVMKALNGIGFM